MDIGQIKSSLAKKHPRRIVTIDSHTAGEPTRLVVDGVEPLPGRTMHEKLDYFKTNLDPVRLLLTREPRGHRDMLAAVVTEPVRPGSAFGLFYMDARRYPHMCGHATIGAVTTLIEAGAISAAAPGSAVVVDTPSGPVEAFVVSHETGVTSVGIRMMPSFVYQVDRPLDVPGFGRIYIDLVCVGGFFAMVAADKAGIDLNPDHGARLIEPGMAIIAAANEQLTVHHPMRPEVTTVDVVEFYDSSENESHRGKSVVVYGESHMDRSPCGTGTTAKMTLSHHQGRLLLDQPYFNTGPLGTVFKGRLIRDVQIGEFDAVVAEFSGSAHITGIHEFVIDPKDPFPEGFLI